MAAFPVGKIAPKLSSVYEPKSSSNDDNTVWVWLLSPQQMIKQAVSKRHYRGIYNTDIEKRSKK